MADVNFGCTVSKCTNRVDERILTSGGIHYLNDLWVRSVRAGTTTKCQNHYFDTDNPTAYAAYIKSPDRRNREIR